MSISFTPIANQANYPDPPQWKPRLKTGYFYVGPEKYYLYAKKGCLHVQELTWSEIPLSQLPIPGTVAVEIEGVAIDEKGPLYPHEEIHNWVIEGGTAWVRHVSPESYTALWSAMKYNSSYWDSHEGFAKYSDDNEIAVSYAYLEWNSATDSFDVLTAYETVKMGDVQQHLFLPTLPPTEAPVVITDDSVQLTDARPYTIDFTVEHEEYPGRGYRVVLNAEANAIQNPSFIDSVENYPYLPTKWISNDTQLTTRCRTDAYHGQYALYTDGTGILTQTTDVNAKSPYTLSLSVRGGTGVVGLEFLNPTGEILSTGNVVIGTTPGWAATNSVRKEMVAGTGWERFVVYLGDQSTREPQFTPDYPIPTGTTSINVKLSGTGVYFDAVQLQEAEKHLGFGYLDPLSTIEYETSESGYYTHNAGGGEPFAVWDLDLIPTRTDWANGFLALRDLRDGRDWQLGRGGTAYPTGQADFVIYDVDPSVPYADFTGLLPPQMKLLESRLELQAPTGYATGTYARVPLYGFRTGEYIATGTLPSFPAGVLADTSAWAVDTDGLHYITGVSDLQLMLTDAASLAQSNGYDGLAVYRSDKAAAYYGPDAVNTAIKNALSSWGAGALTIHNPHALLGTGQHTDADWMAQRANNLVIDGLTRTERVTWNGQLERLKQLWELTKATKYCTQQANPDVGLYALDYGLEGRLETDGMVGVRDLHSAQAMRQYAESHGLGYGYVDAEYALFHPTHPTGQVPPLGAIPNGDVFEQQVNRFGRRDVPYAKVNGMSKLRHTGYAYLEYDDRYEEHPPVDEIEVAQINMLPQQDAITGADQIVTGLLRVGQDLDILVTLLDQGRRPLPGYPVAFPASYNFGTLDKALGYTDHHGRLMVTYSGSATGQETIHAISPYPGTGIVGTLEVSVL